MLAKSQKKEQYTGLAVSTQTATATQSEDDINANRKSVLDAFLLS